jgi:group II intron reverse transcriptase/maturase
MPTWSDKLLQEVIRMILNAYYEPQFSDHSHGFRPSRGCHTALSEIEHKWTGTIWFIEGDISGCFDNIDHEILLSILAEQIHDNRFLRLIEGMLKAGYLEDWAYHKTLSGTPQGGIVSPILANVYLDRLDRYVEEMLLPAYNRKTKRDRNGEYERLANRRRYAKRMERKDEAAHLFREMQRLPFSDTHDAEYRRLRYVRYADDFLLGFAGPRAEAEQIKAKLQEFLSIKLRLELSEQKTLITHAATGAARFLGYDVHVVRDDTFMGQGVYKQRTLNGVIRLQVPVSVVKEKRRRYMKGGEPTLRPERMVNDAYTITAQYQAEFRGFAQYYALAHNRAQRLASLRWVMQRSLVMTLANKFKVSGKTIYERYHTTQTTTKGTFNVLKVTVPREGKSPLIAYWGAISLARKPKAVLDDQPPVIWNQRTELLTRLRRDTCEICGAQGRTDAHHIRALRDLQTKGQAALPEWKKWMIAHQRKQIILCRPCHLDVQHGRSRTQH